MFACIIRTGDGLVKFVLADESTTGGPALPADCEVLNVTEWKAVPDPVGEFRVGCSARSHDGPHFSLR